MPLADHKPARHQCCRRLLLGTGAMLLAHAIQSHASASWMALLDPPGTGAVSRSTSDRNHTALPRSPSPASPAASQPIAYHLDAHLDTARHRVTATGSIRWTNTSSKPQNELWFHLYLNAFRDQSSLFMRAPENARRNVLPLRQPGRIDVLYLRSRELGSVDLWENADKHSPGDPNDATDIRVPLPHPLPPAATVNLAVAFEATLPELVERSGFSGDFYMVAQWFPKLARLGRDGTWSHFPYHPQAEFDADYAEYRIALDVPSQYIVGATGTCVQREQHGDRRIDRYEAANVHDFSWTAWPHFVTERYRVAGVSVLHLFPPGHARAQRATRDTIQKALPELIAKYGAYPYPDLTVVHPPSTAAPASGMEYPTLITTGGSWYSPILGIRAIEAVTAHELAHQWFYGIVASNEYRWPFLDEGLASFAEVRILESHWGAGSRLSLGAFRVSRLAELRAEAANAPAESSAQPATGFDSFAELGSLAYARPAAVLETVARVYGRAALERAIGSYARAQRFRHAEPADLLESVKAHAGLGASHALEQALIEGATVDFRVSRIEHIRHPDSDVITSRIRVERDGTLQLPVEVLLRDDAGEDHLLSWDASTPSHWLEHRSRSPIVAALVDPDGKILLDRLLFNNARSIAPSPLIGTQGLVNLFAQVAVMGLSL